MASRAKITLSFQTRDCDRCGARRLSGATCAECGRKPHPTEHQPDLQRRERLLADFRRGRRYPDMTAANEDSLGPEVRAVIDQLTRALSFASRSSRSAAGLIDAFERLDALVEAWVRPQPRPRRNRARIIGESLQSLRSGYERLLDSLVAGEMLSAQEEARLAQQMIDAAAERMGDLAQYRQDQFARDASPSFLAESLITDHLAATPNGTLRELDARLKTRHGMSEQTQVGASLELEMMRPFIALALDDRRLADLTDHAHSLFVALPLAELSTGDTWRREHSRAVALFATTMTKAFADFDDASELDRVDRLLDAVLKLKEAHMRHLLATALTGAGHDYATLRSRSTGSVFRLAEETFPQLELNVLERQLRHAAGHVDFDVDGDEVSIWNQGNEIRFSAEDFMDRVLEYFELTIALQMALTRAIAEADLGFDLGRRLGVEMQKTGIVMLASAAGWSDIEVTSLGHELRLTASGDPDRAAPIAHALARMVPEANFLRVSLRSNERNVACLGDLAAIRDLEPPSAVETVAAALTHARACAAITVDGRSAVNATVWHGILAVIANDQEVPFGERVRALITFRSIIRGLGDPSVERAVEARLIEARSAPAARSLPPPSAFRRSARQEQSSGDSR